MKYSLLAIAIITCLVIINCGNAESPGNSDQYEGQGDKHNLRLELAGDLSNLDPYIACGGEFLPYQEYHYTTGPLDLKVYSQLLNCNVELATGFWLATPEGVCQSISLLANGTTVTTWNNRTGYYNLSFKVNSDGNIDLSGDQVLIRDCTEERQQLGCQVKEELVLELSGQKANDKVEFYCWAPDIAWLPHLADANNQATLEACPGLIQCNIEVKDTYYVSESDGMCQHFSFTANGTEILTGTTTPTNTRNFSFELLEGGSVEPTGHQIPQKNCLTILSGNTCDLHFEYQGNFSDPVLHMIGPEIQWGTTWHFIQQGNTMTLDIEDRVVGQFYANMDMLGNGLTWFATNSGLIAGQKLFLYDTQLVTLSTNQSGGKNLDFVVTDDCQVLQGDSADEYIIDVGIIFP